MREIPPWVQLTMFAVLVVVLALPTYTSVPRTWSVIAMIAWAAALLLMVLPRRS